MSDNGWSATQVSLFGDLLSHVRYSNAESATSIRTQLISSLTANPTWTRAQINLFDSLLSLACYTDETGGRYANAVINELSG